MKALSETGLTGPRLVGSPAPIARAHLAIQAVRDDAEARQTSLLMKRFTDPARGHADPDRVFIPVLGSDGDYGEGAIVTHHRLSRTEVYSL